MPLQLICGVGFIWGELVLALDAYLVREWFSLQVKSLIVQTISKGGHKMDIAFSDGLVCPGALLSGISLLPRARVLQVVGENGEAGTGKS